MELQRRPRAAVVEAHLLHDRPRHGRLAEPVAHPDQWYLYTGGPMGAAFVALAALVVHRLGVLRLGLAIIAGQLAGSVVLDVTLPVSGGPVGVLTLIGVALTLLAVVISGRAART